MYCQKCRTPLRLEESLESLNPSSFKILVDSAPVLTPQDPQPQRSTAAQQRRDHYHEISQNAGSPQYRRSIPVPNKSATIQNPAMSFVMLSGSQIGHSPSEEPKPSTQANGTNSAQSNRGSSPSLANGTGSLSERMERNLRLFEILSARSDIDHPVCSECTDLLMNGLQHRQAAANRERDAYVEFIKKAQDSVPTEEEQEQTTEALGAAKERESAALKELEELEAAKAAVEDEIAALDREAVELEEEEEAFWRERNAFEATLAQYRDERDSLQNRFDQDSKLLESLQRTNVYNDSFCIGHDGHFGTINGLRLGRLPDHPVEWPEINAAWGQTALLLSVVAEKLGYKLKGYRLIPLGSNSKIEKLEYPQSSSQQAQRTTKPKTTQLELSSNGDLPLGLGFLHRGFDNAMVCFLECLRQLGEHVEQSSAHPGTNGAVLPGLKMPYVISKDKIGDASIKLGAFNQEEMWTKACKYTLTCCKFLLAHASHVDDVDEDVKPRR